MADVNFFDILDPIRIETPGCPEDVIVQNLLDIVRDFCQQTRCWIYDVDMETILKDVNEYDIEVSSPQAMPIAIEYLEVDGSASKFKTTEWLDHHIPNWRTRKSDDLTFFTHVRPRVITFAAVPQTMGKAGAMNYRVSQKPVPTATMIPQELVDEWLEVWADGTKAKLRAMPEKRWTDSKRATALEREYRIGRAQARIRCQRNFGNSEDTATFPFFA